MQGDPKKLGPRAIIFDSGWSILGRDSSTAECGKPRFEFRHPGFPMHGIEKVLGVRQEVAFGTLQGGESDGIGLAHKFFHGGEQIEGGGALTAVDGRLIVEMGDGFAGVFGIVVTREQKKPPVHELRDLGFDVGGDLWR